MAIGIADEQWDEAELFEITAEVEDQVVGLMTSLEQVQEMLSQLTAHTRRV